MKGFSFLGFAVLAAFIITGMAGVANADELMRIRSGACSAIISHYCPEIDLGFTDLLSCLEAHGIERSKACNEDLAPIFLDAEKIPENCRADVLEVCDSAKAGHVRKCLFARFTRLSPHCRVTLEEQEREKGESPGAQLLPPRNDTVH